MRPTPGSWRRVVRRPRVAAASLSIALLSLAALPAPATSQEPFVAGSGRAEARLIRMGPTRAQLTLAPTTGLALSDFLNTLGRGQSASADWAAIGVAVPELPDNTPVVRVQSTDKNSEQGKVEHVGGSGDGPVEFGSMRLFARATKAPLGASKTTGGAVVIPGVFEMGSSEATTSAGVVGKTREAVGVTEVDEIVIGGVVRISGLRWESTQKTGAKKVRKGSFSVEGVSALVPVPGPLPDVEVPIGSGSFDPLVGPINTALAATGLAVVPPTVEVVADVVRVTPMVVRIVDSELGRALFGPALEAFQPIRDILTDPFIGEDPIIPDEIEELTDEDVPGYIAVGVLIADVFAGIVSGSSQLHIEIGGTMAFTEGQRFGSAFGAAIPPAPPPPPEVVTEVIPGTPGSPGSPAAPAVEEEFVDLAIDSGPAAETVPGSRGGAALLAGIVGLFFALALSVGDWRRLWLERGVLARVWRWRRTVNV